MVATVLVVLSRGGGTDQAGSPAITPRASVTSPSPRPSASATLTPTPTPKTLVPSKVTVHVQNGTSRAGFGAQTADAIRQKGYRVLKVDNASTHFAKSTIFYRPGAKDEALAFQEAFPAFTVLKAATGAQDQLLRVVIGSDYP